MDLINTHPQVAFRDCDHCQKYSYDESTGKPYFIRGQIWARPDGNPPPCRTPLGCAKGTPEKPVSLTDQNWQAFRHYREAKVVGFTSEEQADPIVRRNVALIATAESRQDRQDVADRHEAILEAIAKLRRL